MIFIALFIMLIVAVIASSLYDRHLKILNPNENHYKTKSLSKTETYLTVFSFLRNWYKISVTPRPELKELRGIEAVRSLAAYGIIYCHCFFLYLARFPSSNPIEFESVSII